MSEKVIVEFEQDVTSLEEFSIYYYLKTKEGKPYRLSYRITPVLYGLPFVLLIEYIYDPSITLADFSIVAVLFLLIVFLFNLLIVKESIKRRIKKAVKKHLRKPENRNDLGRVRLEFDSDGITKKTNISESYFKWEAITKVAFNGNYFFLFLSSNSAIIIPNNTFANDDDKQTFIHFAKAINTKH